MIRIVFEEGTGYQLYSEKYIECWHCKGGIMFRNVVPHACPKCKAKQPDAENFISENGKLAEQSKFTYYMDGEL